MKRDLIDRYKLVSRILPYGREMEKEQVLEVIMSIPKAEEEDKDEHSNDMSDA